MNTLAVFGALIAALMYVPLTISVWKGFPQNFATYFLWGLLDVIAAGSIMVKGGNFLLPATYVFCVIAVVLGILRTGTFKCGRVEWVTSLLVFLSIVVWMFVGSRAAVIVSSISVCLAGVPQLVDFWHKPREAPLGIYAGFMISNTISTFAGADWSIEERFYPASGSVLTMIFVLVAARRWLPRHRHQLA